jgi:hypothetical protein
MNTNPAQITLKWIKDLNVRPETVKLQEENIGKRFTTLVWMRIFKIWPQHADTFVHPKSKNGQMGLHQAKKLFTVKEIINRGKRKTI